MDEDTKSAVKKRKLEDDSPKITSEGSSFPGELNVGKEYQAVIPDMKPVVEYILTAKDSYNYSMEQLPDKSIGALVRYYYQVKKIKNAPNSLDKSLLKKRIEEDDDEEDSDAEENDDVNDNLREFKKEVKCVNCAETGDLRRVAPQGILCQSCLDAWKSEGALPVFVKPESRASRLLYSRGTPSGQIDPSRPRRCPKGIRLNEDEIRLFTESADDCGASHMERIDQRTRSLQTQTMTNRQIIGELSSKLAAGIDVHRPPEEPRQRTTPKWTENELKLAVQGVRRYGKDFATIAEVIGTKTESHLKQFWLGYRQRYDLDKVRMRYGKDFATIAEVIGTKTESHLKQFWLGYRQRYDLDKLVKEYEEERQREKNKPTVVIDLDDEAEENSL